MPYTVPPNHVFSVRRFGYGSRPYGLYGSHVLASRYLPTGPFVFAATRSAAARAFRRAGHACNPVPSSGSRIVNLLRFHSSLFYIDHDGNVDSLQVRNLPEVLIYADTNLDALDLARQLGVIEPHFQNLDNI